MSFGAARYPGVGGVPRRTRACSGFFSAPRRHFDYAALVTQGSGDTETPPSRGQAPSDPHLDRPTPIVDISREVEASRLNARETARLRTSQITRLVDLTRTEAKKDEPAPTSAPVAAPTKAAVPPPPARRRRGFVLPLVLGAFLVTAAAVVAYTRTRHAPITPPEPAKGDALVPAPTPTLVETAAPPASSPVVTAPSASAPAPTLASDTQARQALERLRTGLDSCIRNRSHVLPGSSPAVPPSLLNLKEGAYTSAPGEWKTYAWSCAQFQMNEPMHVQLQWQLVRPNVEGAAVAWIDQDHDGVADRALGFTVKRGPSGAPIFGEIRPVAATTPVAVVRR